MFGMSRVKLLFSDVRDVSCKTAVFGLPSKSTKICNIFVFTQSCLNVDQAPGRRASGAAAMCLIKIETALRKNENVANFSTFRRESKNSSFTRDIPNMLQEKRRCYKFPRMLVPIGPPGLSDIRVAPNRPEACLERSGSRDCAFCTKNQLRRPILRPCR